MTVGLPGDTLSLTYNSNLEDQTIQWKVESGAVSIISGQNTNKVTIKLDEDFVSGSVVGHGISWRYAAVPAEECSDLFTITRE